MSTVKEVYKVLGDGGIRPGHKSQGKKLPYKMMLEQKCEGVGVIKEERATQEKSICKGFVLMEG